MKDIMGPLDIAEALGISRAAAYEMIRQRALPVVQIGGRLRVPRPAYEQWLANKSRQALEAAGSTGHVEESVEVSKGE